MEFHAARTETLRYHAELYASSAAELASTWLATPHVLLAQALALVPADRPLVAYDLGAGIGRHTVPMLRALPEGSTVWAVDLLEPALHVLRGLAPGDVRTVLRTRVADLDDFEFEEPADLVLAFSVIEHLPDLDAIARLLGRVREALTPGGAVAVGIFADRTEIDAEGCSRPALVECALSSAEADEVLDRAFAGFTVAARDAQPGEVRERRGEEHYTLKGTLVTRLVQGPSHRSKSDSLGFGESTAEASVTGARFPTN